MHLDCICLFRSQALQSHELAKLDIAREEYDLKLYMQYFKNRVDQRSENITGTMEVLNI